MLDTNNKQGMKIVTTTGTASVAALRKNASNQIKNGRFHNFFGAQNSRKQNGSKSKSEKSEAYVVLRGASSILEND